MKRQTVFNGQRVDGTEVGFQAISEPWTEIALNDGATIKIKNVPVRVIRLDGQFNAQGDPLYVVESAAPILVVSCPPEMQGKPPSQE